MNGFLSFFLPFVLFLLPTGTWRMEEEEQEKVFVARRKIFLEEGGELRIGKAMEVRNFVSSE